MRRLLFPALLGVATLAAPACKKPEAAPVAPSQEAFPDLAAFFSPDFPASAERLAACEQEKAQPCLEAYARVQRGREALFAAGQDAAVSALLKVLSFDCAALAADKLSSKEVAPALERCKGAGVAMTWLESPQLDARFRRFFDIQRLELRGLVLATAGEPWAFRRPEKADWARILLVAAPREADGKPEALWQALAHEVASPSKQHAQPEY